MTLHRLFADQQRLLLGRDPLSLQRDLRSSRDAGRENRFHCLYCVLERFVLGVPAAFKCGDVSEHIF